MFREERTSWGDRLRTAWRVIEVLVLVTVLLAAGYGISRLLDDEAVDYAEAAEHFKYGSTGGERGWGTQLGFGIPYWMWVALPELFPQYLPDGHSGRGYSAFGMLYEPGRDPRFDLPVGMSLRRTLGIDRVYFNCAACHTGALREAPGAERRIVLGMPANTFDLGALARFMGEAGRDWRFRADRLLPKVQTLVALREREYRAGDDAYVPAPLGLLDRWVFELVGVAMLRDQLLALIGQLEFMDFGAWGPGRVDTFNSPKALLGFNMATAPARERVGTADFPSVWNQKARKGMQLHWDGNNCSVDERNLSAGFGTGATPATIDRDSVLRTADWLWQTAQPPPFPAARIDGELAARGAPLYREYCQGCHGTREAPFREGGDDSLVGQVTPIGDVNTDRARLDSYTPELAQAQGSLYAGYPLAGEQACAEYYAEVCSAAQDEARYRELRAQCYPARFRHFRKTWGYANMPLDGLWLRAPYLHNGSVPSLRELLAPAAERPATFYSGYEVYDFDAVGFVANGARARAGGWAYDTRAPGNGNHGHEGYRYGTMLAPADKDALIEYLKTF